jgi:hypothetical protein
MEGKAIGCALIAVLGLIALVVGYTVNGMVEVCPVST